MAFSREGCRPFLPRFLAEYPDLHLDLTVSSFMPDLARDQIDMAVVVGSLPDSDFVQQALVATPLIWIASPEVAANLPPRPDPYLLASQIRVTETRYAQNALPVRSAGGERLTARLDVDSMLQVNDPLIVRDIVASGYGVGFAPHIYCRNAIADGTLVQLAPQLQIEHESRLSLLHRAPPDAAEDTRLHHISAGLLQRSYQSK